MNSFQVTLQTSHRLVLAAGLAISSLASTSLAQTLNWNNIAGGSAATAANWNPAQFPGAANLLVWNLPNTFTTTFSAAVPQSASHTFKRGAVTLSMASPHTTSSFVRVGDVSGDSVTTILTAGTLHAGAGVAVGNASGAIGTLTVDNEGSLLDTTAAGSDIVVGSAGTGTMNIADGASVIPADDFIIGSAATGVGHVTVTGTGGLPLPVPSSLLDLTGTGKDLTVGSSGDGFLSVLAGGRVNADEMFVGLNPGSNGSVTVGGIGGLLNAHSQINIATTLHLGDNPGIGLSGGSSTFTVDAGGEVSVLGTTRIGDPSGVGSGTLTMNPGSTFTTSSLIATDTGGFLNLLGGMLVIDGGSLTTRNNVLTLDGTLGSSAPVVALQNGAACTLSAPLSPFEALVVGNSGQGTFDVQTGSHLTIAAGDAIFGNLAGGIGQLQVVDAGSLFTMPASRVLVLGDAGRGSCFAQRGGHLSTGSVILGRTGTGVGIAEIAFGDTVWDIAGTLSIGGTTAAAFGTGTVTIGNAGSAGATVNITSGGASTFSARVWDTGDSLIVNQGGFLNCDGGVAVGGGAVFTLAGGTVYSSEIQLAGIGATYNLSGIIGGRLSLNTNTTTANLTGDLSLVEIPVTSFALFNNGVIEIGDHTLSVGGSSPSNHSLNTCHLGPAGSLVSTVPLLVAASHTLSGDGTVNAPINNSGFILSQGSGLTFTKVLSGIGQGISGTTITFGNGGGFTGVGAFSNATPINAGLGSVITATGNLTMGSASSPTGFNGGSGHIIIAGDFDVTLNDSAQAVVGDVDFPGPSSGSPSISCTTGIGVIGTVTGSGTIRGTADSGMFITGTLSPGSDGVAGTLLLGGDSVLSGISSFVFDVLSATTSDHIETLTLSGASPPFFFQSDITLDGTLALRVNPAHTPASGEEHTLIQCSGSLTSGGHLHGFFHTIVAPPHWIITERHSAFGIGPDSLVAVFCPADFNEDNTVDFFDYLDFVDAFSASSPSADYNSDGTIDFFDYLDFVDAFSIGC